MMRQRTCPHGQATPAARRALGLAGALALAVALTPREVRACKCLADGATLSAPTVTPVGLALQTAAADLRCDRAPRGHIACTWHARYRLHNPGAAQTFELGVTHPEGAAVRVTLDGVVLAERAAADPRARRQAARDYATAETRATWLAPAAAGGELAVALAFEVAYETCTCTPSASARRHPFVARRPTAGYNVHVAAGGPFLSTPAAVTGTHDIPASWRGDWFRRYDRKGGRKRSRPQADDTLFDPTRNDGVAMDRRLRLDPGGPVVAAGVAWTPEGTRARLRAGWEITWPRVLAHSLVVETDARRRITVIPTTELACPTLTWILPDLGIGVGAPMQLVPDPRVGVRFQGRLGFWIFHLITTFDHFPGVRGLPRERLGALMLQVGF